MKLLTQDEGAQLKPGDRVNVAWFTPRQKQAMDPNFSITVGDREEWLESVWYDQEVDSFPFLTASDGWAVKLKRGCCRFLTSKMEKVEKS